jgi:uncharacterized protein involved in outer membrane biogenesis
LPLYCADLEQALAGSEVEGNPIFTMRRLRIMFAVLVAAVALVAAAALVTPYLVDTDRARRVVSTWMSGLLGREVHIQGTMRFTLLPILGFVIEDFSVAGGEDAMQEPLARIQRASLAVAPWPLIQRRLVVERIHLQGPRIRLVRDGDGRANWAGVSIPSRDATGRTEKSAVLMQFEQVTVSDGSFHLQDSLAGREIVVSDIAFRRRGKGSRTFTFGARADWRQSPVTGLEGLNAVLRLTGDAVVDPARDRYAIDRADLRLTLQRPVSSGTLPLAVLEAVVSADALQRRVNLAQLRIGAKGARLNGSASGRFEEGAPTLEARLRLEIEAFQELLASLDIETPSGAGYNLPCTADLETTLSVRPGELFLDDIQGVVDGMPVAGRLTLAFRRPVSCQAHLRTGKLDLDAYLPSIQAPATRKKALPPKVDLDLMLEAEAVRWRALHVDQVALQVRHMPGDGWRVKTAGGRFAGGDWRLEGKLQSRENGWTGGHLTLAARDAAVAEIWPPGPPCPFVRGRVDLDAQLRSDGFDPRNLFKDIQGKVVVSTRRPLQLAYRLRTKIQGRVGMVLAPGLHLALDGELNSRQPDLEMAFESEGTWDPRALVLDGDQTSLRVASPALPGPVGPLHLDGNLSLSLLQGRAAWHETRISLPGLGIAARGDLDLARVGGAPVIDAGVDIAPVALRPFLERWGWAVRPADPSALDRVGAALRFHYDGRRLTVRDLNLHLDDTRFRGTVDIAAFEPLQARFKLAADRVDLDRYLPWSGGPIHADQPSDTEPVDIQGTLTIGRLTLFGLDALDVSARVAADGHALRFDPVRLTLYEGATAGMFEVALDDSDPFWQTRAVAGGIQLRRPLEILFGRPVLSGKSDIEADLYKRRKESGPTVAGLNGKLNLAVRNGRIHDVRIVSDAGEADAQPVAAGSADSGAAPFQPFDLLEGSWTLTDGVAVSGDHRLNATGLEMAAAGRVDFVQKRLGATLSVNLPTIPVVYYALDGPFGDIRVRMDRTRLVLDTTTGIITSPLRLGQGTLGIGADILERGGEAIGDGSGVQRLGQGAMSVGQGVLEMGKGVLELHKGGESLGEGARSVGGGIAGMGKGVVGMGKDVLDAGLQALEGFGKGLERLFGGGEKSTSEEGEESRPGAH